MKKKTSILCVVLWLFCAVAVYGQDAGAPVRVQLSLADNKSSYRIGEPVKLIMEFTADTDGYQADTMPDSWEPTSDTVSVSPDSGINHWLNEYMDGQRSLRDVISLSKLSPQPTRVELMLNDTLRFDRPGTYKIKVTTHRVSRIISPQQYGPPITLTSNELAFEVRPMSAAEEEAEVKRLSDLLDAARGWQAEEKITRELSYLAGDPSSREKVRRFLNSEGRSGNYSQHLTFGLFIARNRALVLQLLESAMRDPKTPVNSQLLYVLSKLRYMQDSGGAAVKPAVTVGDFAMPPNPRLIEARDAYVMELAAGLGRRAGKSQSTTAVTILLHLPKEQQARAALLEQARRIILQQFDSLHPFDQEYLLRTFWEQLKDPTLAPALKKMMAYTAVASKNIHDSALKRLLEIAPNEARAYVIAEIRNPASLVELDVLGSLSDKSLPEVDEPLLEQIRQYASSKNNFASVYLRHKTALAVRYASVNIYGELMQVYRSFGARMPLESRAALLAYFARYNEAEALPLIEQTLEGLPPGQDFNFLPDLARLYYSDAIDALLLKRLEMDEPRAASTAAYLLSLHGRAADVKALEARLERWRKEWGHRADEAEANQQGTVERELIMALIKKEAAWKLPPERVKELKQSCLTRLCRQNFRTQ